MSKSLHPNLARIAANYDDIFRRFREGRVNAATAKSEITALVARDDEGVLWSIDPDTGDWLRRTRSGELVAGDPPSYGLATPTPHDLSSNRTAFDPDHKITFTGVDDELLYAPTSLAGSTRRPLPDSGNGILAQIRSLSTTVKIAVVVIAILLAVFLTTDLGSSEEDPGRPGTPTVDSTRPPTEEPPLPPPPSAPTPTQPGG